MGEMLLAVNATIIFPEAVTLFSFCLSSTSFYPSFLNNHLTYYEIGESSNAKNIKQKGISGLREKESDPVH